MKISIITPSYNQGIFIEKTIKSVLNQDYSDFEYLIYDGGSTDKTTEVLQEYSSKLYWISEKDNGQAHAVNKGIMKSSGDIIGWLNSDDIYYPGTLEKVADFFKAHPNIDILYGNACHIDREDKPFEDYPTQQWSIEQLKETCFICQPTVFFRKNIFKKYGLLREDLNYCMDYEYWLRLSKENVQFGFIPEKLAGSRMYQDNKTLGARIKVHAEINDMFQELFGEVPTRWVINYAHVQIENKIDRNVQPKRFLFYLILISLWSSFKWNKKITPELRGVLKGWCFS